MHNTEFLNILDYISLAIIFISLFVGFFKGFIKDFFGSGAWFASAFAASLISPYMTPMIHLYVSHVWASKVIAILIAYIIILITLKLTINIFAQYIRTSFLSGIDRAFGTLFGLIRGIAILLCSCVLALNFNFSPLRHKITAESKISLIMFHWAYQLMPKIGLNVPKDVVIPNKHAISIKSLIRPKIKKQKEEKAYHPIPKEEKQKSIIEQWKEMFSRKAAEWLIRKEESKIETIKPKPEETPSKSSSSVHKRILIGPHGPIDLDKIRKEAIEYRKSRPKFGMMDLLGAKEKRAKEMKRHKLQKIIKQRLDKEIK